MKLYVCCFSTFVALNVLGPIVSASTLTPSRISSARSVPSAVVVQQPSSSSQYKSFHEWKNSMVSTAETKARQTQDAIMSKQRSSASTNDPNLTTSKGSSEAGLSSQIQQMQLQLEKEEYQVSIAKELTISDYFVGYLTKQKDLKAAISEVSGRLTPEEVAELMSAYATNFFSSQPSVGAMSNRSGSNQ